MVASTNVAHLQEIIETQRRRINELETELEHKYKTKPRHDPGNNYVQYCLQKNLASINKSA